jgi:hypothetical protein
MPPPRGRLEEIEARYIASLKAQQKAGVQTPQQSAAPMIQATLDQSTPPCLSISPNGTSPAQANFSHSTSQLPKSENSGIITSFQAPIPQYRAEQQAQSNGSSSSPSRRQDQLALQHPQHGSQFFPPYTPPIIPAQQSHQYGGHLYPPYRQPVTPAAQRPSQKTLYAELDPAAFEQLATSEQHHQHSGGSSVPTNQQVADVWQCQTDPDNGAPSGDVHDRLSSNNGWGLSSKLVCRWFMRIIASLVLVAFLLRMGSTNMKRIREEVHAEAQKQLVMRRFERATDKLYHLRTNYTNLTVTGHALSASTVLHDISRYELEMTSFIRSTLIPRITDVDNRPNDCSTISDLRAATNDTRNLAILYRNELNVAYLEAQRAKNITLYEHDAIKNESEKYEKDNNRWGQFLMDSNAIIYKFEEYDAEVRFHKHHMDNLIDVERQIEEECAKFDLSIARLGTSVDEFSRWIGEEDQDRKCEALGWTVTSHNLYLGLPPVSWK